MFGPNYDILSRLKKPQFKMFVVMLKKKKEKPLDNL